MANIRQFVNKNLVLIVMIPLIFGSHYGWMKLQNVDALVKEDDRKNLPAILQPYLSQQKAEDN